MSKTGPDIVDMIVATWCNIAIPAILSGCEMIPFSETNISEIDKVQCQVAKYALGLPISAANISSQLELGMKSFKYLLYEHQSKFYIRTLNLPNTCWVKQALLDHLSVSWTSPYLKYIYRLRTELGLYELPLSTETLVNNLNDFFLNKLSEKLQSSSLSWLRLGNKYKRLSYTREGVASETIAKFKYDSAGIGNKYPRENRVLKQSYCPLCPTMIPNTVSHIALFCPSIERLRNEQTVIASFRNMCQIKGVPADRMYELLIYGEDWGRKQVSQADMLSRGSDLRLLLDAWLLLW